MIALLKQCGRVMAVLLCISGCTSVYVRGMDGIDKTYYPGVVYISVAPGSGVTRVETKTIGVVFGDSRIAVGWSKEDLVAMSDDCVIALFQSDVSAIVHTVALLRELNFPPDQICVANGRKDNEENDS